MTKVYVTGSKGMVGSRFVDLAPKNVNIIASDISELDVTQVSNVEEVLGQIRPEVLVHFAAYTDVDDAESQRGDENGSAWKINVQGTRNIALACKSVGAFMVNISTDFVFPGNDDYSGPYKEDSKLPMNKDGLSWYGWTKLQGEVAMRETLVKGSTVRISYPYRSRYRGKIDFVRNILSLFDKGKLYTMFEDQIITPTFVDEACRLIYIVIKKKKEGIFHAVSSNPTTPYLLASYLIEKARGELDVVKQGSMKKFLETSDRTPRPRLGGLLVNETQKDLKMSLMSWKEGVDKFVKQRSN